MIPDDIAARSMLSAWLAITCEYPGSSLSSTRDQPPDIGRISAGGDRCIKVWCIHTGKLLTTVEAAHPRGIASLDFQPARPSSQGADGRRTVGTIVSGSSDATVRLFTLSTVPAGVDTDTEMPLVPPMRDLTFQEMLDTDMSASGQLSPAPPAQPHQPAGAYEEEERVVHIDEGQLCWTECLCPPGLVKPDASHCMRCWNRGHTDLIRSVSLRDDVVFTGSYDTTVKVCPVITEVELDAADRGRYGTVPPVDCSMTYRAHAPDESLQSSGIAYEWSRQVVIAVSTSGTLPRGSTRLLSSLDHPAACMLLLSTLLYTCIASQSISPAIVGRRCIASGNPFFDCHLFYLSRLDSNRLSKGRRARRFHQLVVTMSHSLVWSVDKLYPYRQPLA